MALTAPSRGSPLAAGLLAGPSSSGHAPLALVVNKGQQCTLLRSGAVAAVVVTAAVGSARSKRRGAAVQRHARGGEKVQAVHADATQIATEEAVEKPALLSAMQFYESMLGQPLDNPFVDGNFAPVSQEIHASNLEVIEGAVPANFPDGLYVRNGPNPRYPTTNVEAPLLGRSAQHWFEGDGMLHSVRFSNGKASYRNRFVRTQDFLREEAAGEALYRPSVQVTPPASILNAICNTQALGAATKDVANTNIIFHGGRLLAITEGAAMPTVISLDDLSTLGTYDFGADQALPSFTAHPRIDPQTGELIFASYSFFETQTGKPGVHIGVVSPDGKLKHWSKVPSADRNTLMHDVAITERWTVITDFPLTIDPSRMFSEEGMVAFEDGAPTRIGLVPRYGTDVEQWFEVANGYAFHLLNAYEDGDDVVVRGCHADSMDLQFRWENGKLDREAFVRKYFAEESGTKATPMAARLHEWRLHLKDGSVTERDVGAGSFVDFPVINSNYTGRPHRFGYCSAMDIQRSIEPGLPVVGAIEKYTFCDNGEVTTEQHLLPEGLGGQEVAFVPRPGAEAEDDGWLLMFAHDSNTQKSELRIIDAQNITGPAVARIALPQRVPFGFHGTFVPQA